MKVINIIGGPGAGKSTSAADLFSAMKKKGYKCELVTEYAKDLVWQKSMTVLSNQIYVFGKQFHRIWRLKDQVDFIITDSPLLLSLIYNPPSETFEKLVHEQFSQFENINFFIARGTDYDPVGRNQNLEQSIEIDNKIIEMFRMFQYSFTSIPHVENKAELMLYVIESTSAELEEDSSINEDKKHIEHHKYIDYLSSKMVDEQEKLDKNIAYTGYVAENLNTLISETAHSFETVFKQLNDFIQSQKKQNAQFKETQNYLCSEIEKLIVKQGKLNTPSKDFKK